MSVSKTCEQCGSQFSVKPAKRLQRFCSFSCRKAAGEAVHAELTCEECRAPFTVTRKRELSRRFCSKKCQISHEATHGRPAAQAAATAFLCAICGNQFLFKPAYLTEYRKKFGKDPLYCSRRCMGLSKRLTDEQWQVSCIQCGKPMPIQRRPGGTVNRQKRLCSTQCRSAFRRARYQAKHAHAEPTRRIKRGYVVLNIPGKDGIAPRAILEHRYVMEQFLGRPLLPEETVHHRRAWDKTTNTLENLELRTGNHGPGGAVEDIVKWCVDMLTLYAQFIGADDSPRLKELCGKLSQHRISPCSERAVCPASDPDSGKAASACCRTSA